MLRQVTGRVLSMVYNMMAYNALLHSEMARACHLVARQM